MWGSRVKYLTCARAKLAKYAISSETIVPIAVFLLASLFPAVSAASRTNITLPRLRYSRAKNDGRGPADDNVGRDPVASFPPRPPDGGAIACPQINSSYYGKETRAVATRQTEQFHVH